MENDAVGRRLWLAEAAEAGCGCGEGGAGSCGCGPTTASLNGCGGGERVSSYTYTADGQIATLTLVNDDTGNQVTRWVYGTTLADSGVARKDLLRAKIYPMSDDSHAPIGNGWDGTYQRTEYGYNRQGTSSAGKIPMKPFMNTPTTGWDGRSRMPSPPSGPDRRGRQTQHHRL